MSKLRSKPIQGWAPGAVSVAQTRQRAPQRHWNGMVSALRELKRMQEQEQKAAATAPRRKG